MSNSVARKMRRYGYHLREPEYLAIQDALMRREIAVIGLVGAPGTGKTYLSEIFAKAIDAEYLYYLANKWTTDQELVVGINVAEAVAGSDPSKVYLAGVLMRAARLSQVTKVVVCIDEIDKTTEAAEAMLLEFLQNARVYEPDGTPVQGVGERIFVFITSNNLRPLMEPTLRRMYRVEMDYLPVKVELDIVRKRTGAPMELIELVHHAATIVRKQGSTSVSIQEIRQVTEALMRLATNEQQVILMLHARLVKSPRDAAALKDHQVAIARNIIKALGQNRKGKAKRK